MKMRYIVKCPWCNKGEIRADNKGDLRNSCICPKCTRAFIVDWEGLMPISTIAKDYGKSAVWLNKWLHEQRVQYKQGQVWLLYQTKTAILMRSCILVGRRRDGCSSTSF